MTLPARGTLAWKLSAIGLVQLILLAAVFMGVGRFVNGPPPGARRPEPALGPDGPMPPRGPRPPEQGPFHDPPWRRAPQISPLSTLFFGGLVILGIGSLLTARSIVRPLRDLARVANALGAGDLRARSTLERSDELGELARTFNTMGDRIERLLLAEKELLANVSHELRTPLARIRVALDIAGEGDPEAGRLSMSEIAVDLSELETLIDDILTTTRLEISRGPSGAAHFELHPQEMTVAALCERVAGRFRARHPARPLDLTPLAPDLPSLRVDPVLFRRVFDNLLENAHKYTPDGASPIALRASREGGTIAFEVEDHGLGISAEDVPRLFTPFFRGDRSRTRGTGGVGLGLALARRIVEAHGGTIDVTSAVGSGTRVRVAIPAAAAEPG